MKSRNIGRSVSDSDYKKFKEEQTVFRDWFHENILVEHPESLSNAVMLLPYGPADPQYRDLANELVKYKIATRFRLTVFQSPGYVSCVYEQAIITFAAIAPASYSQ